MMANSAVVPGKRAQDRSLMIDEDVARAAALGGTGFVRILRNGWALLDAGTQERFGLPAKVPRSALLPRIRRTDRRRLLSWIRAAFMDMVVPIEMDITDAQGQERHFKLAPAASSGTPSQSILIILNDITSYYALIGALRSENDHLRYTVELNPELPWIAEPNGHVIDFTERWLAITGLEREDALGNGWTRIIHPEDLLRTAKATQNAVTTGEPFDVRFRAALADGALRWMRARGFPRRDEAGKIVRWYGYTEDVHDIVLVEQSIQWNADHDALTGLPNRALFNRHLEIAVSQQCEGDLVSGKVIVLLLLDVDNFKDVNDILGHDAGDDLLIAFGRLLKESFPQEAIVARVGGDEFAVLLELSGENDCIEVACQTLFGRTLDKVAVAGRLMECRTSVGAASFPDHGMTPTELFKSADIALYRAKSRGRGRLVIFNSEMLQKMQERLAMINLARSSAEDGSIIAYYQPQVSFDDGSLLGFEALLRRRDRHGRIHLPGSLAAAFEDLNVAEALGVTILNRVIDDMTRWRYQNLLFHKVAINVSTAELRHDAFAERLVKRLDTAGIAYSSLTIEVTEGVFLGRSAVNAIRIINELSRIGFPIALDDFGTGYASLSHLRQIHVDTLKIDRSFVSELGSNHGDHAIVTAIVNLGRSLGLEVVAEGIETVDQAMILRKMGCQAAQGFLCSYPAPAEAIPSLIRDWNPDESFLPFEARDHSRATTGHLRLRTHWS